MSIALRRWTIWSNYPLWPCWPVMACLLLLIVTVHCASGQYQWDIPLLKNIRHSAWHIAENLLVADGNWQDYWREVTGIALKPAETKGFSQLLEKARDLDEGEPEYRRHRQLVADGLARLTLAIINGRSHTGWTTSGHTSEDVQIFSYGKNHEVFTGSMENTDIAKKLFNYLGNPRGAGCSKGRDMP